MKDVVTIVGSFQFKDQKLALCDKLSRQDKLVFLPNIETSIMVEPFAFSDVDMVKLNLRKIDMSEAVYVAAGPDLNSFHIGYSTTKEIDHALGRDIPVYYVIGDDISEVE